ncbi:cell division protein FtsX [Bdellovibrio bacteriovorus]|uniref:cell division protein FtsX n=1 Tax=Bdellovibrio bacteriovorus TaxID=959 RepID=UPI0035A68308
MRSSKNWALKVSTLVVVTACFAVMAASLLVSQNFKNLLTLWGEDVQMTVYLSQDLSEQGRQSIEETLKKSGKVGSIHLVTQEKALGDFRAQLASYAPDLSQDEELLKLIPSSLQVRLAGSVTTAEQISVLRSLAASVKGMNGVDEVSYGQDWIEKYSALVMAIEMTLHLLSLVILAAAVFVISNAIRASVQNRKDEIVVMEMIGATFSSIRKPFMVEGATVGLISSLLSITACFVLFTGIKNLLMTKLSFLQLGEHLRFLTPTALVLFIVGGTCLGALASYICVRRINDGYAGSQRS